MTFPGALPHFRKTQSKIQHINGIPKIFLNQTNINHRGLDVKMTSELHDLLDMYIFPGKLGTKGVPERMYVGIRDSGSFIAHLQVPKQIIFPRIATTRYLLPDACIDPRKDTGAKRLLLRSLPEDGLYPADLRRGVLDCSPFDLTDA